MKSSKYTLSALATAAAVAVGEIGEGDARVFRGARLFHLGTVALLALVVSHGISFAVNFIGRREYQGQTVSTLMSAPYRRIIVMHLAIILGAATATIFDQTTWISINAGSPPGLSISPGLRPWCWGGARAAARASADGSEGPATRWEITAPPNTNMASVGGMCTPLKRRSTPGARRAVRLRRPTVAGAAARLPHRGGLTGPRAGKRRPGRPARPVP